jgi:hypothetical protein
MALDIRVTGAKEVREPEHYIAYQVAVRTPIWSVTVEKRYSNFLELHRVMKLRFRLSPVQTLPKFPGQKIWKQVFGGLGESDIEERKSRLEAYMRELESNPCSWDSQYFIEFLQIPQEVVREWVQFHIAKEGGKEELTMQVD